MPVRTAETLNPYRLSRMIPMMLGTALGNVPQTKSIIADEPFTLSSAEPRSVRHDGRYLILGWKVGPDEDPLFIAGIQIICDGITVADDLNCRANEYIVGPSKLVSSPGGGGIAVDGSPIPQFAVCESYFQLQGQVRSGVGLMLTSYVAVELEYA